MTKVAVVAVHGVADQAPASSARSIADLLCADNVVQSFTEVPLRVPRERMNPGTADERWDCGLHYMHEQLQDYRPPKTDPDPDPDRDAGTVYETVRLEGNRIDGAGEVHVHEVYWADLSRAGDTWYRLLAEFYALILHLPSLGRNGLKYAKKENNDSSPWTIAYRLQQFAVWMLTVPAPIINVVMLSAGLIAVATELPGNAREAAMYVTGALILAALPILALRRLAPRPVFWTLWSPILLAGGLASYLLLRGRNPFEILALEGAIVGAAATMYLSFAYSTMKPKAWIFGVVACGAMLVAAWREIAGFVTSEATAYLAALETVRTIYVAIVVTWLFVFAAAVLAALAGLVAIVATPRGKRLAAYRATWTARFSLAFPAALFAIFTLAIWYLVIEFGIKKMAPHATAADLAMWQTLVQGMRDLLQDSAAGFEYFLGALGIFVLGALFAALPSVLVEIKHPRGAQDDESIDLGRWLSRGIIIVAIAAEAFTIALFMMLYNGLAAFINRTPLVYDGQLTLVAFAAGGVGLILTGKRFIQTFRAAVDVLLDVDNYLRESPKDAAPRARIAERFVSLLRHLCEMGYQKIVIVAHSQGTVIAADALRYLNAVSDPALKPIADGRIELRLFTMGSPLRQLYAKAFPYLYSWIKDEKVTAELTSPDPKALTLQQWANVYCSGDYVGRNLWIPESNERLWVRSRPTPTAADADGNVLGCVEFCAGAGAHTHYWDMNGRDVAAYLKAII